MPLNNLVNYLRLLKLDFYYDKFTSGAGVVYDAVNAFKP